MDGERQTISEAGQRKKKTQGEGEKRRTREKANTGTMQGRRCRPTGEGSTEARKEGVREREPFWRLRGGRGAEGSRREETRQSG